MSKLLFHKPQRTTELSIDEVESFADSPEFGIEHVHLLLAVLALHLLQLRLQLLQLLQQVVVQQHLQTVLLRLQLKQHRPMFLCCYCYQPLHSTISRMKPLQATLQLGMWTDDNNVKHC